MYHGYYGGFMWDRTMLLIIPALLLSAYAQFKVKSTYNKYKQISTMNGYTGEQVARMILDNAGLNYIPIEVVNRELGDHYDPRSKVLRLSPDVFYGRSIASAGIAAHEVGHAIQHKESYAPLQFRNTIFPAVNISSSISIYLFILGLIFSIKPLTFLGIVLFSVAVLFQIVTLPVEFNASSRALNIINSRNILVGEENRGAQKVLTAAALTYVAATLMAVMQLVRLILISRDRND